MALDSTFTSCLSMHHAERQRLRPIMRLLPFKFIDSIQHIKSSLDDLSTILDKSNAYNNVLKYIPQKYHHLVKRKLKFAYEYIKDPKKLLESEFPPYEAFYSKLKGKNITRQEYEESKKTYEELGCKNLLEYYMFYNRLDVLILSDVLENYRKSVYNIFGLDPANYVSSPSCAWDCMLRSSGVIIGLIHDREMYDF
jgi:hypothetical protein